MLFGAGNDSTRDSSSRSVSRTHVEWGCVVVTLGPGERWLTLPAVKALLAAAAASTANASVLGQLDMASAAPLPTSAQP